MWTKVMARLIGRLTELHVMRAKSGWHNDGGGLYLRVETKKDRDGKERKSRWWVYRYGSGGKAMWRSRAVFTATEYVPGLCAPLLFATRR